MLVLTIRTDKPEAEIGLFDGEQKLAYETWEAHRQLAETIHTRIEALLKSQKKDWHNIKGIVCFQGPGSFTGLRIGLTVGNALSYGLDAPIVATQKDDWIKAGINRLGKGENDELALPHYGAPVHITKPRK
jgi:tRNA threonylcarbamoyladenosine biosynthesis protein TsaB